MGQTLTKKDWKRELPFWTVLALLLIWPLLFVNKGVDLLDTEFYLGYYKWGLRDPSLLSFDMPLSDITGALLYSLLPSHQLLIFRLLDVLANWGICLCIYKMVGKQKNTLLLLGMLLGSLFLKRLTMTLSYNSFSTLLCALAMLGTVRGLEKENTMRITLAGAAAGIAVLYRPPNLLMSTIILAIPLYGLLSGWSWKKIWQYALVFVGGYFLSLAAGFMLVIAIKGFSETMQGYLKLAALGTTDTADNPHSIKNMLLRTANGLMMGARLTLVPAAAALAVSLCLGLALHFLRKRSLEKRRLTRILGISAILTGLALGVAAREQYWADFDTFYFLDFYSRAMALACLVGGCAVLFCKKLDPKQAVLGLLLGGSVFYMALGTSNGLFQFILFGAPIVGLTVYLLGSWAKAPDWEGKLTKKLQPHVRFVSLAVLTSLLAECLFVGGHLLKTYTYWDEAPDKLTTEVRVPELAGMKTTPEKAAMLEQFHADMSDPALEGYPLAITESFCAAYVIADNEPFFPTMWPSLDSYNMKQFKTNLETREAAGELPIIVVFQEPYLSVTSPEKTQMLKDLAERQGYAAISWQEDYRILVPPACYEAMEKNS